MYLKIFNLNMGLTKIAYYEGAKLDTAINRIITHKLIYAFHQAIQTMYAFKNLKNLLLGGPEILYLLREFPFNFFME